MKKAAGAINSDCSNTACCWSDKRGTGADEKSPDRIPKCFLLFLVWRTASRHSDRVCESLDT
jgi:hypothetical protein